MLSARMKQISYVMFVTAFDRQRSRSSTSLAEADLGSKFGYLITPVDCPATICQLAAH